jgi:hypothetical protein
MGNKKVVVVVALLQVEQNAFLSGIFKKLPVILSARTLSLKMQTSMCC